MNIVFFLLLALVPTGESIGKKIEAVNERQQIEEFDRYSDSLYRDHRYKMSDVYKYPKERN